MRVLLLVLACACRMGEAKYGGVRPRVANDFTLAMYQSNDDAFGLAQQILARSSHAKVTALDTTGIDEVRTDCPTTKCGDGFKEACARAGAQGLDYFGVATVKTRFGFKSECVKGGGGDLLGHGETCLEFRTSDERSAAIFELEVFDAKTCHKDERLSRELVTFAWGREETSKPEALRELTEAAPRLTYDLPDQVVVLPDGRVVGNDGQYAVFRGGAYRGYARVDDGEVSPMMLGLRPRPGDVLSKRGPRRFLDAAAAVELASITFDGSRELAPGVGAQLRYYSLDGGLQLAGGIDLYGGLDAHVTTYGGEVGWGVAIATGLVLSANVGGGVARARQFIPHTSDSFPSARVLVLDTTARLQTFLATFLYVTVDLGYVHTRSFDGWHGSLATDPRPVSLRSPFARLSVGLDF